MRCANYLVHHHIAHTTNYDDLVGLMVSYGAQPLTDFAENAAINVTFFCCDRLHRSNQCVGGGVFAK